MSETTHSKASHQLDPEDNVNEHLNPEVLIQTPRTLEQTTTIKVLDEVHQQEMPFRHRIARARNTYIGALVFNLFAFSLPALYDTLVKLWIANIDSSLVVTTDSYTYIGVIVEVLNEGLPRAAYVIIGDRSRTLHERLQLSFTLIIWQSVAGFVMSLAFLGAASQLAAAFVPEAVRQTSITYVRISSFQALTSALDTSVSLATRALDRPDVPLAISLTRTFVNIILDLMFLSTFRIHTIKPPTINTQATIRLICNTTGSLVGLIYFATKARRLLAIAGTHQSADGVSKPSCSTWEFTRPTWKAWITLARPGAATFTESAVRNALYLWLISGIVSLGSDYATAWGVFNTIRWGLVMVPVSALEATTSTFVGHEWGAFWTRWSANTKATWQDLIGSRQFRFRHLYSASAFDQPNSSQGILRPAIHSIILALLFELPLCLLFSLWLTYPFALYLTQNTTVAAITTRMWRTIDWCYIFYAVNTQMAAVLLATRPRWYLGNSLVVNVGWVAPWCIALQVGIGMTASNAWRYHAIIFGGSLVLSFWATVVVGGMWIRKMLNGTLGR